MKYYILFFFVLGCSDSSNQTNSTPDNLAKYLIKNMSEQSLKPIEQVIHPNLNLTNDISHQKFINQASKKILKIYIKNVKYDISDIKTIPKNDHYTFTVTPTKILNFKAYDPKSGTKISFLYLSEYKNKWYVNIPFPKHPTDVDGLIIKKMITLESNEHFLFNGDISTTTGTKEGKQFSETKQLNTKLFSMYPSKHTNKGMIKGSGYIYICTLKIITNSWHPDNSRDVLNNIGWQLSKKLSTKLRNSFDSRMNPIGKGYILLLQGDYCSITLNLFPSQDESVFHLVGTYIQLPTETKLTK